MPKRVAAERDRLRRQIRNLRRDGLSDRAIERTLGLHKGAVGQYAGAKSAVVNNGKIAGLNTGTSWTFPPLPDGPFRCLVIDPPWPMGKSQRTERPAQGKVLDYPVMSVEQIAALRVPALADEQGCQVYLWVTHRFLPDGLRLFEHWGVTYHCALTWVKNVGMTPYSWMFTTEHILFGYSGRCRFARVGQRLDFAASANGHSVKPGVFYDRVRAASFERRLEMFAREPHEGFEAWGNEAAQAWQKEAAS